MVWSFSFTPLVFFQAFERCCTYKQNYLPERTPQSITCASHRTISWPMLHKEKKAHFFRGASRLRKVVGGLCTKGHRLNTSNGIKNFMAEELHPSVSRNTFR
jgi:hypothetical protein